MNDNFSNSLELVVKKFVETNSNINIKDLSNISLNLWFPLKASAICDAGLELSYVLGHVDQEAYSRAKETYQIQKQNYQIAYNQYVQAENQYQTTVNREKDLEWHRKSSLTMPIKPSHPISPDVNNFIEWNNSRSFEKITSSVNSEFLIQENQTNKKYFDYLNFSQKSRQSHTNFFNKVSKEGDQVYLKILNRDINNFQQSINVGESNIREVDDILKGLFYLKAENYMKKWYSQQIRIENINYSRKDITYSSAELYVGNYSYRGKLFNLVIDKTNFLINGDLPSNFNQLIKFTITHIMLLLFSIFINVGFFWNYWDDFIIVNFLMISLNYIGFLLILSNFSPLSHFAEKNSLGGFFGTKINWLQSALLHVASNTSFKNTGLNTKMISMDLNDYLNR